MIILLLFILGLILGSFLNAVVWRLHGGEDFIRGRSHCDLCGHQLKAFDLVPLLSWLAQSGRCRYCHQKLSWQHPVIELAAALVFVISYVFWPGDLALASQKILFISWLLSSVGLIALAIYDLKWTLLPNKLIYPTLLVAFLGRLAFVVKYAPDRNHAFLMWLASLAVASGFFWILYIISRGRWIGFGDVRLGLVTGTLLATPELSFLMIFAASLVGSLISVPLLAVKKRQLTSRLPYGPFLILATSFVLLFGQSIIDWYNRISLR